MYIYRDMYVQVDVYRLVRQKKRDTKSHGVKQRDRQSEREIETETDGHRVPWSEGRRGKKNTKEGGGDTERVSPCRPAADHRAACEPSSTLPVRGFYNVYSASLLKGYYLEGQGK